MLHDAINTAVPVGGKLGGVAQQSSARRGRVALARVYALHDRSTPGSTRNFAYDGEFLMSLRIPASSLAAL
jgi:hypothetical protein